MIDGFLSANRYRSYPFLRRTVGLPVEGPTTTANLPNLAVVDCGFLAGPRSGFDPATHSVYLSAVRRSGGSIRLDFASDCPGLHGATITFTRSAGDPDYAVEHADSGPYGGESASLGPLHDCGEPLWSGYLVSGSIDALSLLIAGDGVVPRGAGATVVEPALVQSMAGACVSSLSLANDDRTRAESPPGCESPSWPYPTGVVFVADGCITGEVLFEAGYNAIVRQASSPPRITLGAAVGAGAGVPCSEVPLFPGESPGGDGTLSGGPRCNGVLRSVNGQGGPLLSLVAGPGTTITPVPDQNTVVVDVNMNGLALCFDPVSRVSERL